MPWTGISASLDIFIEQIGRGRNNGMCVAIPGKVIEIMDETAKVDFNGNCVNAMTGLVSVQIGDYVLVHAGCIIQKLLKQEAEELIDLMREVEGYAI